MTNFTAYLHWNAQASARTFYRTSSVRRSMNCINTIMNKFKNQLDFVVVKSIPCCCWKSKWNVNNFVGLKKWMCSCVSSMHWPPANYLTQTWKTCIKQWLHDGNLGQFFFQHHNKYTKLKFELQQRSEGYKWIEPLSSDKYFILLQKTLAAACCEKYTHTERHREMEESQFRYRCQSQSIYIVPYMNKLEWMRNMYTKHEKYTLNDSGNKRLTFKYKLSLKMQRSHTRKNDTQKRRWRRRRAQCKQKIIYDVRAR